MNLTPSDYNSILKYYNININGLSDLDIKKEAEHILATKMCRCIKKINSDADNEKNESRAIAICKKSVLGNKNLKNFRFTCKKKYKFIPNKSNKNKILIKTKNKLNLTKRNK
jgi:hypothetical protein